MRIISWNIRFDNKHAEELIREAFLLDPDILCLQEVRGELIPWMRTAFPHHYVYGCLEVSHLDPLKQNFLCTITKTRTELVSVINYEQKHNQTLYENIYFRKLNRWTERHAALVISVPVPKGLFRIINIHLSSAISPLERASNFQVITSQLHDATIPTVFCGDFNIIDNFLFRLSSGWMLGYRPADYKTSERLLFETMFRQFGLVNIFSRMSTHIFPWQGFQLDHILVPEYIQVTNKTVGKKRYASDHRMILVDVTHGYYGI